MKIVAQTIPLNVIDLQQKLIQQLVAINDPKKHKELISFQSKYDILQHAMLVPVKIWHPKPQQIIHTFFQRNLLDEAKAKILGL